MSQLQAAPLPLRRTHPATRRTVLAPRKELSHHVFLRKPISPPNAMVPGRNMWSSDGHDDPSSSFLAHGSATPTSVSIAQLPLSQQSLNLAFHMLDKDMDGLISATEAYKMVAFYLALQDHTPPVAVAATRALSWDQHLLASISSARKLAGQRWSAMGEALETFVAAKMLGGLQTAPPRCSDLVWAGLGMCSCMLVLGLLLPAVKTWPVVGPWHQQGLPLLLGSFGTFAILLFGKPQAEAVRLWPLIAGQLGATAIVVSVIQVCGASVMSRAAAMAATVMYMMWTDTIHPPGGALVLMAMGDHTIQQFGWLYMLWPSLLLCLGVMLPISAVTNWLRRTHQFDWPGQARAAAASLHKKQQEWNEQQQRKQELLQRSASVVLGDRIVLPRESTMSNKLIKTLQKMLDLQNLQQTLKQQLLEQQQLHQLEIQRRLQQKEVDDNFKQDVHDLRQRMITPQPRSPENSGAGTPPPDNRPAEQAQDQQHRPVSPSMSSTNRFTPSISANLDGAVRRRLRREADRKLEDEQHREAIWGAALPGLRKFEHKLQKLHEQRLRQQHNRKQQKQQQPVQPKQQQQQLSARGVWETGVDEGPCSTGGSVHLRYCSEQQQHMPSPQSGLFSKDRPAWMYRWRSDISTQPGVGDWDEFAPDDN